MSNQAAPVDVSENHSNVKSEKPAMIAKEPTVAKPMAYEPNPIQKSNGLSNGTTNHKSYSLNQRMTSHYLKILNLIADIDLDCRLSLLHE